MLQKQPPASVAVSQRAGRLAVDAFASDFSLVGPVAMAAVRTVTTENVRPSFRMSAKGKPSFACCRTGADRGAKQTKVESRIPGFPADTRQIGAVHSGLFCGAPCSPQPLC